MHATGCEIEMIEMSKKATVFGPKRDIFLPVSPQIPLYWNPAHSQNAPYFTDPSAAQQQILLWQKLLDDIKETVSDLKIPGGQNGVKLLRGRSYVGHSVSSGLQEMVLFPVSDSVS